MPGCPALDFVDVEFLLTADTLGKYNLGPSVVVEYSDAETVQYRNGGDGVVRALTVTNLSLQNVIVLKVWGDIFPRRLIVGRYWCVIYSGCEN